MLIRLARGPSLSDAARLRDVGGFTDVQARVNGQTHQCTTIVCGLYTKNNYTMLAHRWSTFSGKTRLLYLGPSFGRRRGRWRSEKDWHMRRGSFCQLWPELPQKLVGSLWVFIGLGKQILGLRYLCSFTSSVIVIGYSFKNGGRRSITSWQLEPAMNRWRDCVPLGMVSSCKSIELSILSTL